MILAALATLMPHASDAQSATYETLYSFQGSPDGADPRGALVIGTNGALYGTTFAGGAPVDGTVFALTMAPADPWKETVLHSFNGSDGQYPQSALVYGNEGALYGATVRGGPGG